jgi:hypothetical protein
MKASGSPRFGGRNAAPKREVNVRAATASALAPGTGRTESEGIPCSVRFVVNARDERPV